MNDEQGYLEELQAMFVETYLRVKRLEGEREHSAGCIVKGGKEDKYYYWQKRVNGRKVWEFIPLEEVMEVEKKISVMKQKEKRLKELKHFLATLEKMMRAVKIQKEIVLAEFEAQQQKREQERLSRSVARNVAAGKRYAENYKHVTDRGEQVASKSELIIANVLFALGVRYEYEREFVVEGKRYKPDFTVWRPDGTMLLWEHAGLMDDPDYAWNFQQKLRAYQVVGFKQTVNVIVTYDENRAFSAVEARRMVEIYKLI